MTQDILEMVRESAETCRSDCNPHDAEFFELIALEIDFLRTGLGIIRTHCNTDKNSEILTTIYEQAGHSLNHQNSTDEL